MNWEKPKLVDLADSRKAMTSVGTSGYDASHDTIETVKDCILGSSDYCGTGNQPTFGQWPVTP